MAIACDGVEDEKLHEHHLGVVSDTRGGRWSDRICPKNSKEPEAEAKMFAVSAGYERFMGRWSRLLARRPTSRLPG